LLLIFVYTNVSAQRYSKYIFGTGYGATKFCSWGKSRNMSETPLNSVKLIFFLNKNWGIGVRHYTISTRLTQEEEEKYTFWDTTRVQNVTAYGVIRHISDRGLRCVDLPIFYRLNYKNTV